jgi:hypothetical protein
MVLVSAMPIRVYIRTIGDDLSLKLVVFRQVPPLLALISVWTLRHMVISRRSFPWVYSCATETIEASMRSTTSHASCCPSLLSCRL